jgi:hypothetical protein
MAKDHDYLTQLQKCRHASRYKGKDFLEGNKEEGGHGMWGMLGNLIVLYCTRKDCCVQEDEVRP